ncbi:nicotinate-nucleotide diphosphorylase (carboxylating) [Oligella urethralis]|uniref:carboxylating nicotinate-nucleotide diphosphorylase n=1 Tax=Oligella urethralis TaxID=90245 RepID=UPI000C9A6452|nr:carboxylating nicotinate-nucleotide diphosphorylase [Oligella urethralis]PMC18721.1 nicotinate-nucleotide diphosphorylase (carboxylating) [Oligella urethralis]
MTMQITTIPPLSELLIEPLVRATLVEDLGRAGDITSDAIIPAEVQAELYLVARAEGVLAGLDLARLAFKLVNAEIVFEPLLQDGARLQKGSRIARVAGPARAMLTAERTALNFLCHLSGIASVTARIADSIAEWGCKVTCTRKTTPLMRTVEKYAVRVGGGQNHRFGLDDAILIKDNHIAIAGSLSKAVERARAAIGAMVKIEVEVDTLEQLDEALALGVEVILLDNMSLENLAEAVRRIDGRAISEASGGVTPETAVAIAKQGVNLIAIGWLTHSAPILDIGLDALED